MSQVRDRISEDLKNAMKAKEQDKVSTLRMIKTAIVKEETSGKGDIDEAGLLKLLKTMKKQREESIEQYEKGNRQELADQEKRELAIIETYLPAALSEEEVEKLVKQSIEEVGATSMKDMGKVMKATLAKAGGQTDGKVVSGIVKRLLG